MNSDLTSFFTVVVGVLDLILFVALVGHRRRRLVGGGRCSAHRRGHACVVLMLWRDGRSVDDGWRRSLDQDVITNSAGRRGHRDRRLVDALSYPAAVRLARMSFILR